MTSYVVRIETGLTCVSSLTDLPNQFHESFVSLPALHPSAGGSALGAGHCWRVGRKRRARSKPAADGLTSASGPAC